MCKEENITIKYNKILLITKKNLCHSWSKFAKTYRFSYSDKMLADQFFKILLVHLTTNFYQQSNQFIFLQTHTELFQDTKQTRTPRRNTATSPGHYTNCHDPIYSVPAHNPAWLWPGTPSVLASPVLGF